jgi:ribonuclease P/MRP protein subunit RPP40
MRWKTSAVRPIHRKDDRSEITNYRPIALISNFAKLFEYVLYNSSLHYVSHKLSPNQHGFTETNLVSISQYLSDALDNHSQVDVHVYTDLSKAFDRIDHGLLLIKLESFGFSDSLVELIRSYLSDRFMYVGVNGYASKSFKQESGVPQGSVLGPLFFIIFINDLVDDLDVPHLLFADDMKIYLTIDSIDDALRLQGCIEEMSRRCKLNNLVLNHLKCSIVSFTRKTKPLLFDYKINGSILTRRESIRDLGVIFNSKLSFGEHIRTIAGTAFRALGFVLRAGREFSDVVTLKLLYITYVRSRLEYASLVWSSIYDVAIVLLLTANRLDAQLEALPKRK